MNKQNDPLAFVTAEPDISMLQEEYRRSGGSSGWWGDGASDVRLMRWNGQSKDGRKHREDLGKDPFPWENAFDSRVPTVDLIVNFLVSVLMVGFRRAAMRCQPTEINDQDAAGKVQKAMEYYRRVCRRQLNDEAELLLQTTLMYGSGLFEVFWERRLGTAPATMEIQEILGIAAQAPSGSPFELLPAILGDPEAEVAAADLVLRLVPDLRTMKAARKFVRALREKGVAQYRRSFVAANRPAVRALRFGRDVFVPPETTDLQTARVVFVREFLTEAQVIERTQTEGWDPNWAKQAVATQGTLTAWATDQEPADQRSLTVQWSDIDTESHLIEVISAFQRQLDDQDIPTVTATVWCPHVKAERGGQSYAKHGPADLSHQELPFVVYQWERLSRRIQSSRGVPEIAYTWQLEEKTQADMLEDLASVSVNPPRRTASSRAQKYEWGPGAQVVGRQGEQEIFHTNTSNSPLAFQIMEMIRRRRSEYFGIAEENVPPVLWQTRLSHIVAKWMSACEEMFAQMTALVLDERNVSDEELARITGVDWSDVDRSPEAIARGYDWSMTFDPRDLDIDYTLKKLETVAQMAVPLDREGVISFSKLVRAIVAQVDPGYVDALFGDPKEAADKIVSEVDAEFIRMAAGNEARYVVDDPTAEFKRKAAQQIVERNPKYQESYKTDERFRAVVDNYIKNLDQSLKQQENMQTGRTGVKPL